MSALLSTFALLAFAWVLHLLWWRVRVPGHQMGALAAVFACAPLLAVALWLAAGGPPLVTVQDLPAMALFYVGGFGCYLIAYTGVEETSPSLAIVQALEKAGPAGCAPADLSSVITDANFVKPRIDALKRDGMLSPSGGGFVLTPRGRKAAGTSLLLSRLFNIQSNA